MFSCQKTSMVVKHVEFFFFWICRIWQFYTMIKEKKLLRFVTTRDCECTGNNHTISISTEGEWQLKTNTDCIITGNILRWLIMLCSWYWYNVQRLYFMILWKEATYFSKQLGPKFNEGSQIPPAPSLYDGHIANNNTENSTEAASHSILYFCVLLENRTTVAQSKIRFSSFNKLLFHFSAASSL